MKRFFQIFGAISAVIVLLIVGLIAFVAVKGRALDRESKAYADSAIVAIATKWDQEALIQRESPEFKVVARNQNIDSLFEQFRELGLMTRYGGAKGDSYMNLTTQSGKRITAGYAADCDFEHGRALIRISLIKHDDQWSIVGFRVIPEKPSVASPAHFRRSVVPIVRKARA
jgi:hypothetical protein